METRQFAFLPEWVLHGANPRERRFPFVVELSLKWNG